jgi:hypothetical protein
LLIRNRFIPYILDATPAAAIRKRTQPGAGVLLDQALCLTHMEGANPNDGHIIFLTYLHLKADLFPFGSQNIRGGT